MRKHSSSAEIGRGAGIEDTVSLVTGVASRETSLDAGLHSVNTAARTPHRRSFAAHLTMDDLELVDFMRLGQRAGRLLGYSRIIRVQVQSPRRVSLLFPEIVLRCEYMG